MLVISAGMQKSGSAYIYSVINEILARSGRGVDARELKGQESLASIMKWHNNNIGRLSAWKLLRLVYVSIRRGAFVVKTHSGPSVFARVLKRLGLLRIIYCYRDPRDVLLSAIDHGEKIVSSGENHTFASMVDFGRAFEAVKTWVKVWERYSSLSNVHMVRYEDFIADPDLQTQRIEKFLRAPLAPDIRSEILWKFSKDNPKADRRGAHFNKAKVGRYIKEMKRCQRERFSSEMGDLLSAMGYSSE